MILVNGAATETVAVTDRGLAYGDGVFRTLRARGGRPECWRRHYRKLARDCEALELPCPPEEILASEVSRAAGAASDCVVKIIVTRGSGARGYAPPKPASPTRVVIAGAVPEYPEEYRRTGVRVHLCRMPLAAQPRLAGVKHLNRLENVLARGEWDDPGVPEGLLLDGLGNAIGGTMTNLFMVEGEALLTPELTRCGVAGVARERVLAAAARDGVVVRVEALPLARVLAAREVLLVNSVIGAWPVKELAGRRWPTGQHAARVQQWLAENEDA